LSQRRRTVDKIYDYRYSVLLNVFARLLRDGWLTETDLVGLQEEKIEKIKIGASL
jgi:Photoprotection regulator fluorescence recovery protein